MPLVDKQNIDIIIIVIASRGDIYDDLINNYWSKIISYSKQKKFNIKFFLIFGNNYQTNDLNIDDEDKMILNISDNYIPGILNKTIKAFEIINQSYSYKHIFRTNLSSFLILDNLIKISESLNDTKVFAGVIGNHHNIIFVSGAGFWLSEDYINYILNNYNKLYEKNYHHRISDDVCIGILLPVQKIKLHRFDLTNNLLSKDKKQLLEDIIKNNHYHIRIKNEKNRMLIDMDYMNAFTNQLYTLQ